jgi:hypothetical protein
VNDTQLNALQLIWTRIKQKPENQQNILKQNLFNELSEMVEFDDVVCATGRYDRIIDTLNIVDDEVKIIPKKAIK